MTGARGGPERRRNRQRATSGAVLAGRSSSSCMRPSRRRRSVRRKKRKKMFTTRVYGLLFRLMPHDTRAARSYTSPNSPLPGRGPRSLSRHGNQVSSADPEETDGELPTAPPDRFPVCIRSSSCAVCRGPFAKAMFEFLNRIRMHQGDKNGKNSELKYDAQCGMSKGVFEWQCRQFEKVSSRTPELMRKMRANAQKMRVHFKDTEDLKTWDAYERNVLYACEHYLKTSLATPVVTPNSVLYEDLMKRKAYSKTCSGLLSMGLNKFKYGTRSLRLVAAGAAIGLAVGLGVGWKQQKIKK